MILKVKKRSRLVRGYRHKRLVYNMINKTLTIVLAGGEGSRLQPLTRLRAKPSVPFGGKYRIIDFTLSNCLHSGLRRILVLTQYKSHSLQKHLRDGWSIFNPELGEYITPVPAQMRHGNKWYQGTADAIHQNNYLIERSDAEYTLILSGDHIYRMDYAAMLETHKSLNADVTVACMKVPLKEAHQFGIMTTDENQKIVQFEEKPEVVTHCIDNPDSALASMGIYVFSTRLLLDELEKDSEDETSSHDFGKDILPKLIHSHNVCAHYFGETRGRVSADKYWRDVGTIESYYQANMDLLESMPSLDLYQTDWPVRSYQSQTPPARAVPGSSGTEGVFINSILSGGTIISGSNVAHSILFQNVYIDENSIIEDSVLFDNVKVGKNVKLYKCIIDKHVSIPDGEEIGFDLEKDRQRFTVTDNNIVVVPQGYSFEG
ncbi:MAG: glucose-1-phosphate adenylyltransferase [Gammaproteobacteria bacterium]|nr:glucose-1-phosphate adenylyltransferase [Gammaproteobacteria bacterium]MCW9006274.1 glucose-1-phosphate adenylyltransferase [Gammaproteobacteria bacterium]